MVHVKTSNPYLVKNSLQQVQSSYIVSLCVSLLESDKSSLSEQPNVSLQPYLLVKKSVIMDGPLDIFSHKA